VLFEIDPRPFQAALDQARGQKAQADAQLGSRDPRVERDIPLAESRAIRRSQLENDIQTKLAAAAALDSAKAAVKTAQLNLEFTKVRSLTDGIAGIARDSSVTWSGVDPAHLGVALRSIKAYVAISEREYLQFVGWLQRLRGGAPVPQRRHAARSAPRQWHRLPPPRQVRAGRSPGRSGDRHDPDRGGVPNPANILRPGSSGGCARPSR